MNFLSVSYNIITLLKALFNLLQKSSRKLAANRSTNLLFLSPSGPKQPPMSVLSPPCFETSLLNFRNSQLPFILPLAIGFYTTIAKTALYGANSALFGAESAPRVRFGPK